MCGKLSTVTCLVELSLKIKMPRFLCTIVYSNMTITVHNSVYAQSKLARKLSKLHPSKNTATRIQQFLINQWNSPRLHCISQWTISIRRKQLSLVHKKTDADDLSKQNGQLINMTAQKTATVVHLDKNKLLKYSVKSNYRPSIINYTKANINEMKKPGWPLSSQHQIPWLFPWLII